MFNSILFHPTTTQVDSGLSFLVMTSLVLLALIAIASVIGYIWHLIEQRRLAKFMAEDPMDIVPAIRRKQARMQMRELEIQHQRASM